MSRCAGVDWAKDEHRILCVLESDGRSVSERCIAHDERGIASLCALLVEELGVERVAIERPEGLLVERLLEAGLVVLPIHPNQLKAARPRFRASGGKSDGFDAFVLAELARTDQHRFRALVPDSDETKAIRALTRAREDLVDERVALANRLRAELEAFWPGAARLFAEVDSPISLAFLARYPRAPKMPVPWARNALRPSSRATATAAARRPPSSSKAAALGAVRPDGRD